MLAGIPDAIAALPQPATMAEAQAALDGIGGQHRALAERLFASDGGNVLEDALVTACRSHEPAARLLVWCALNLGEYRLADAVENFLTSSDGKLDPSHFDGRRLEAYLASRGVPSPDKSASNILRWFETAGLIVALRDGPTVVGFDQQLPTAHAVPGLVQLVADRIKAQQITPAPGSDLVALALGLGVNHWLNLTPDEFRAAANPSPAAAAATERQPVPPTLAELHRELFRKGQVILQGPPGTGKTFLARQFVTWFTAGRNENSHLAALLEALPSQERTPLRVAEKAFEAGLAGVWEIVQFHPSLTYDDFVRSLRAEPVAGGVTFVPTNRVFAFLCEVAKHLAEIVAGAPSTGGLVVTPGPWVSRDQVRDSMAAAVDPARAERNADRLLRAQSLQNLPSADRGARLVANDFIGGLRRRNYIEQNDNGDEVRLLALPASTDPVVGAAIDALGGTVGTASHRPLPQVLLVVDEINRADISKVLGELIYGLEYRDQPITTPYSVDGSATLTVPSNLFVIGTMNTADRSIALIDYALRRRFVYLDVNPEREAISASTAFVDDVTREAALVLFDATARLFEGSAELRTIQVGHSYFLPDGAALSIEDDADGIARRFAYEVVPLLFEYDAEGRFQGQDVEALFADLALTAHPQDGAINQVELVDEIKGRIIAGTLGPNEVVTTVPPVTPAGVADSSTTEGNAPPAESPNEQQ